MRRRLLLCFLLPVAAAIGLAVKAPAAGSPTTAIAPGVRIGQLEVGGLTSEPARNLLRATLAEPLKIEYGGKIVKVSPQRLGAGAAVDDAISRALHARTGERVPLSVTVDDGAVHSYVRYLARRFNRKGQDARLAGLSNGLAPIIAADKPGVAVRQPATARAIKRILAQGWRGPMPLLVRPVSAEVTRDAFGPVIVIHRGSNRLYLYSGERLWRVFGVATGQSRYPTPLGLFSVVDKQMNPWWRPPDSDWAKGLKPIPPGPGNPLGTRWMGLSAPGVGIHGTPDAASIGYSASHGCIRMQIPDAEWLFGQVGYGTPVYIVSA